MITMHPYNSFTASISVLEDAALEPLVNSCLACLEDDENTDPNMIVMWENHKAALSMYTMLVCLEIERRKLPIDYMDALHVAASFNRPDQPAELPWFVEDKDFNLSHKSYLLRKNNEFYSRYGWEEHVPTDLDLFFEPKE